MNTQEESTHTFEPFHFGALAIRSAALMEPRLALRWASQWERWSPGLGPPPNAPWAGQAPIAWVSQLDYDQIDPVWAAFCSRVAHGLDSQSSPSGAWLGTFWISLCMQHNPEAFVTSHPLALARLAELARAISTRPWGADADSHAHWLGLAKPLADGILASTDPSRALAMLGPKGLHALRVPARLVSLSQEWCASLADRVLAECLRPHLPGKSSTTVQSRLMTRLPRCARALIQAGARPELCARALADSACVAWLSVIAPHSDRPDDNRPWRLACQLAFGDDLHLFAKVLYESGADRAARALGPTCDEIERAELDIFLRPLPPRKPCSDVLSLPESTGCKRL